MFFLFIFLGLNAHAGSLIAGGTPVLTNDPISRFTVAVGHRLHEGRTYCSGEIIAPNLVLTAAHCMDGKLEDFVIHFGPDATKPEAIRQSTAYYVHPHFDPIEMTNDLAILEFDGGLPVGYSPITLAENAKGLNRRRKITLAGYGIPAMNELNKISLRLESVDDKLSFKQTGKLRICHGDSGGPALISKDGEFVLVGIGNSVLGDGNCAGTSYYTRVDPYLNWIRSFF